MKKSFTIIVLALFASLASAQKGVTFTVDKNLPAPKTTITMFDAEHVATQLVRAIGVPKEEQKVVKTSFEGEHLCYLGDDNFFKCMVQAYADHRPLVLSPDMVWLIISQGFSRYVNAHAEEMRDLLVFHEGKMELVVNSNKNILLPTGDWERLLNDFSACIARNTKGELSDLMTADFTTTGITERIASQVSLMDVVKKYFIYTRISAACGIPSIELKGLPSDWQKVLDKARCLKKYNLEKWASDLEDILKEFVEASKGRPNKKFWQSIVKKRRVDQLVSVKGCLPDPKKITYLDGWFLKFFPNAQGETPDKVIWDTDMPQEMVRVNFRHVLTDPDNGMPIDTIPMQLWAGFVGVEEDANTHALTPKIGWLARIADEESDEVARLKEEDRVSGNLYISLNKDEEMPIALSKMDHIRSLRLNFWDNPVVIPKWLDKIPIDELRIMGKFTDEEETQLRQRFPKAEIERFENLFKDMKLVPIEESKIPSRTKKKKAVKVGDKISGTLSDDMGPLFGATVCEIDAKGRIVETAITDTTGQFTMKVRNPQDQLRFSYVGMKTIKQAIDKKGYKIKLQQVSNLQDMRMRNRQTGQSNMPIPQREVTNAVMPFSMEEIEAFEFESEGDGVPNENNPRVPISLTDEEQALVMPVNDLGFNMFRKVGADESILLSPLGMTYALGLINNGAAGETRKQINQVLGCDDKKAANINKFCRKMLTETPKLDKLAQIDISNKFTSHKSNKPKPTFKEVAVDKYDTQFHESESEVNLTGVMSALMPNAFNMKKADFSNLFDMESCISMIKQLGRIKVDETGTEATVTEALQGRIMGLDLTKPETIPFYATHPFLYFIREWSTGTIFFIGQYMGK